MRHSFRFLTQGLRNGVTVGGFWPSSKGLSSAMVAPIFTGRTGPLRVLEVGAGIGPFTHALVERLQPGDTLDVVELNEGFCQVLRDRFAESAVVPEIHAKSILDFTPPHRFHHVVSGLPLANFPFDVVQSIYAKLFSLLEPGGMLVMFEHILTREVIRTFAAPKHRKRMRQVMDFEARLKPLEVETRTVVLNLPPARVVVRRRPTESRHDLPIPA